MKPTFKIFCFCPRLVAPALVSFLIVLAAAKSGRAAGGGTGLQLSPNVYATPAGGQITLRGSFNFFGPFTSVDDGLLGLSPASPHLGIVAGSVLSSQNNNPPVNGAYFFDRFSGGYLGPTTGTGPVTTGIINLRTFVIPAGTPPGTYHYAYGVSVAASIVSTN